MRTSLNNIKVIDDYLFGDMATSDRLLFEANLLLNSSLSDDVQHQKITHAVIKQYGRQCIKAEIKAVQQTLANAPQYSSFMQRIVNLFKK
ncbi:hypothetical protein ACFQZS_14215 [Mucilaginibacter calamicampi]|uniref:Uncharacterized protein n=1 Tax=Mucilaginibacter calamicampi TaxID=1302352 RepID=A0ABW2YXT3_9SPHI